MFLLPLLFVQLILLGIQSDLWQPADLSFAIWMDFQDLQDRQDWSFQIYVHSQIRIICIWFQNDLHSQSLIFIGLGHHFGGILGSWGTTLAPCWWSLGARVQSGVPLNVPMLTSIDFWWILGGLLAPLWDHFLLVSVIWGIKKHVSIAGAILREF